MRASARQLKSTLTRLSKEALSDSLHSKKTATELGFSLDTHFLGEAQDFLSMGLVNFLGYKYLAGGGYRSWAYVTLYYSNFYAANCLLRLAGKAIVHLEWDTLTKRSGTDGKPVKLEIIIERVSDAHDYRFKRKKKSDHHIVFSMFGSTFSSLMRQEHAKFIIDDRFEENYDLLLPSQSTTAFSVDFAKNIYEHDFANPDYGQGWSWEAGEYLADQYAGYGYKEHYSADWLRAGIELMTEIGYESDFRDHFVAYFSRLIEEIKNIDTKPSFHTLVASWLQQGVDRLTE